MEIRCVDLPGIGRKYTACLADGRVLVVVLHHGGHREIYLLADVEAEEALCNFELTDEEARRVGTILLGADYQPVTDERAEMLFRSILIDWIPVAPGSALADTSIKEARIRTLTGATVIGIQRGEKVIGSPEADEILRPGDVLMVVGKRDQIKALEKLCRGSKGNV